jgi:hypothetical protein
MTVTISTFETLPSVACLVGIGMLTVVTIYMLASFGIKLDSFEIKVTDAM